MLKKPEERMAELRRLIDYTIGRLGDKLILRYKGTVHLPRYEIGYRLNDGVFDVQLLIHGGSGIASFRTEELVAIDEGEDREDVFNSLVEARIVGVINMILHWSHGATSADKLRAAKAQEAVA